MPQAASHISDSKSVAALGLGLAISRFSQEPGNWEMGGPEPGNPSFGFRFRASCSEAKHYNFSTLS